MENKTVKVHIKPKESDADKFKAVCEEYDAVVNQYVKAAKRNRMLAVCLVVLLILTAASGVVAYDKISTEQLRKDSLISERDELKAQLSILQTEYDKKSADFDALQADFEERTDLSLDYIESYSKVSAELDNYKSDVDNLVAVVPGQKVYHKIGCLHLLSLDDNYFSAGERLGEQQCSKLEIYKINYCKEVLKYEPCGLVKLYEKD